MTYAAPTRITAGGVSGKVISKFCAGYKFALLLASDGTLFSFGKNSFGQLGRGLAQDDNRYSTPGVVALPGGATASDISCGYTHSVVLATNGQVYAWGSNSFGQIFMNYSSVSPLDSPGGTYNTPFQMNTSLLGGQTVAKAYALYWASAVILANGEIRMHGSNLDGGGGISTNDNNLLPWVRPNIADPAESFAPSAGRRNWVRLVNGTFVSWGYSHDGASHIDSPTGDGWMAVTLYSPAYTRSPYLRLSEKFVSVACTYSLTAFLSDAGRLFVMGNYPYTKGMVPKVTSFSYQRFNKTGTPLWGHGISQITGSEDLAYAPNPTCGHTLILRDDGAVLSSGCNYHGNLGDGTRSQRSYFDFTNKTGPLYGRRVVSIASAAVTSYAVRDDGTAWGWGRCGYEGLLYGVVEGTISQDVLSPTQLVTGSHFIVKIWVRLAYANSYAHTVLLNNKGEILGWGYRSAFASASTVGAPAVFAGTGGLVGTGAVDVAIGEFHISVRTNTSQWYGGGMSTQANSNYQLLPSGTAPAWTILSAASSRIGLIAASQYGSAVVRNDTQLLVRGCTSSSSSPPNAVCGGGTGLNAATIVWNILPANVTWKVLFCQSRTCYAQDSRSVWYVSPILTKRQLS